MFFAKLIFVLVLEVPAALWMAIPSQERDKIRDMTIMEHCTKEARMGATKFVINERIHKFNYQLHIEPVERRL